MLNFKAMMATALLGLASMPTAALASTWEIDPVHSTVGFSVRHLMITNVTGNFGKFSGTVELDDKNIAKSVVDVTIDVASIDTGNVERDKHLRNADFFDVEKFPTMTFKSTQMKKVGKNLKVTGDLTIRGVTKKVVLDVEGPTGSVKDPWGNTKRGAAAKLTINREDFGLTWNKALEAGGVAVGKEVKIALDIQLTEKKVELGEKK